MSKPKDIVALVPAAPSCWMTTIGPDRAMLTAVVLAGLHTQFSRDDPHLEEHLRWWVKLGKRAVELILDPECSPMGATGATTQNLDPEGEEL